MFFFTYNYVVVNADGGMVSIPCGVTTARLQFWHFVCNESPI